MDSGLIIGIIVFVIIVIISIVGSINESVKKTNLLKEIEVFDKELKSIEVKIKQCTDELSNWVYACKKCQNKSYKVSSINQNKASIICLECYKNYEIKVNNA